MFGGCSLSIYLYDYYCLLCFISTGKKQHQSPYSLNRFPHYYHWCISSPAMIGFGDPRPIQLLKMVIQVVDFSIQNGDFFYSYVKVYQRVLYESQIETITLKPQNCHTMITSVAIFGFGGYTPSNGMGPDMTEWETSQ